MHTMVSLHFLACGNRCIYSQGRRSAAMDYAGRWYKGTRKDWRQKINPLVVLFFQLGRKCTGLYPIALEQGENCYVMIPGKRLGRSSLPHDRYKNLFELTTKNFTFSHFLPSCNEYLVSAWVWFIQTLHLIDLKALGNNSNINNKIRVDVNISVNNRTVY